MDKHPLKIYPNKILSQTCKEVDLETELERIKALSFRFAYNLRKYEGVGIAANQIGLDKRIFMYLEGNSTRMVINPQLEYLDDEMTLLSEGCLSIPGMRYFVARHANVRLTGFDLLGSPIVSEPNDFTARIFQHELDHLNGKLIIDHLDKEKRAEFENLWQEQAGVIAKKRQNKKKRKKR